ncbi:MAG TPA: peptidoglycan DD-metalloendopeptidase family protein [Candidatus Limnocylindrales bacterium]|nr:peptidoglycan DD-metalloendopeptidase family protein [Candidatus Limnocylindrales bacterium]
MKRLQPSVRLLAHSAFAMALSLSVLPSAALARCGDGVQEAAEECDDGNNSSGDCCSSTCTYEEAGTPCSNFDACHVTGVCDDGECAGGEPLACDDGNPCTVDYCNADAGGCQANAIAGCCTEDDSCDDGVTCNGQETCVLAPMASSGSCHAGTPVACDDGDACTVDQCVPAQRGCQHTPSASAPGCVAEDVDGDGVWDRFDNCLDTPPGMLPTLDGCSSGDMSENPLNLIRQSDAAYAKLISTFLADETVRRERKLAQRMRKTMERGAYQVGAGRSCTAVKTFFKAEKLNDKILFSLNQRLRNVFLLAARRATAPPVPRPGDHRAEEAEASYFELTTSQVQKAATPFLRSVDAVAQTCAASVPVRLDATVSSVTSGLGRLLLSDGTLVRAAGAQVAGLVMPGARVVVTGERVGLQDVVGGSVISTKPNVALAPFDITQCYKLRIAPVQPAEALDTDPLLHPFDGYRAEGAPAGQLWLERGMAIYVEAICTPPGTTPDPSTGKYLRYTVRLSGSTKAFLSSTTAHASNWEMEAGDFWKLPDQFNGKGQLKAEWYSRECDADLPNPCGSAVNGTVRLIRTEIFPMSVTGPGGYCHTQYEETEFALPDRDPSLDDGPDSLTFGPLYNVFEPTSVVSMVGLNSLLGGTRSFHALAYKVTGPDTSTYPDLEEVAENEDFAIYPTRDPYWESYDEIGVDHPAGVAWPTVRGVRNGASYQYACIVPPVVRDVVDFCPTAPDSYYKLPYKPELGLVKTGQGNDTDFTHCGAGYPYKCAQKYAFDFSIPNGKPIVAARGGTVIWVRENAKNSCSSTSACKEEDYFCCIESSGGGICVQGDMAKLGNVCHADSECDSASPGGDGDCRCTGNSVWVEHSDGSVALYAHMQEDKVDVEEGDRVYRGDPIGITGNTGCSTGPHLHFHVIGTTGQGDAWQKATRQVRFEHDGGDCFIPPSGSSSESTNRNWLAQ